MSASLADSSFASRFCEWPFLLRAGLTMQVSAVGLALMDGVFQLGFALIGYLAYFLMLIIATYEIIALFLRQIFQTQRPGVYIIQSIVGYLLAISSVYSLVFLTYVSVAVFGQRFE